jgi:hypothetical protein
MVILSYLFVHWSRKHEAIALFALTHYQKTQCSLPLPVIYLLYSHCKRFPAADKYA